MSLIKESLESLHVKCKLAPPAINDRGMETLRLRVGGHDLRKEMFKGWVEVERFVYRSSEGSFCVMKRDEVSLTWLFFPPSPRASGSNWSSLRKRREVLFHGDNCGRD